MLALMLLFNPFIQQFSHIRVNVEKIRGVAKGEITFQEV